MSKSDTCLRCGKPGHTSSSCPLPIAPHKVEPYDSNDRMVRCIECQRQGVLSWDRKRGCLSYVPSLAAVFQHCSWFLHIPTPRSRARA